MNASMWKVLREVQFGLFITKSYVRWSGVRRRRRRRCPKTKRVPRQNGFMFRCHDATNMKEREKERERERERQLEKYQTYLISKDKNSKVRMHEHVTCKFKCIMGSAQSKPTNTQHSNKVNTHHNTWNIVIMHMWCNAWSFKLIEATPNPKVFTKSHQFWKIPKNSSKTKT